MPKNRDAVCSVCNQPIKTVRGALRVEGAPIVCRSCFGEQTYAATPKWTFSPVGGDSNSDR